MILTPKKKTTAVVGVDIDSDSVAAAAPAANGVVKAGVERLPDGAVIGGEVADVSAVSAALSRLFSRGKLPKQARLAVASQSVAFRTVRLPMIEDPEQLKSAVRFQAQEQIPMPLDSAVLDHQVIGARVDDDGSRHVEVAVVAARRQSIEAILAAARDAGLDPVGIDLAAFGMIRALAAPTAEPGGNGEGEAFVQATLYCSLGGITNLAIARDYACLFSRVAQFGVHEIGQELAASAGLLTEHAEMWLLHTGLAAPLEEVPGDPEMAAAARESLERNVGRLADELRLSLDFYGAQEGATPVGSVVLCGWGSAIPGLPEALSGTLGREVVVRRPPALTGFDAGEAARLTLPYGLGLER
jgi:type IV pilus assembly protein PilM